MRSLLVVPRLPRPVRRGEDLRYLAVAAALADLGPAGVFAIAGSGTEAAPPRLVVWRSATDPEAGDMAAMSGADLGWLADPTASPADSLWSPAIRADLAAALDELRPEVVVVGTSLLHRALDWLTGEGWTTVLDLPSLEHRVQSELAEAARGRDGRAVLVRRRAAERFATIERAAVASAAATWVSSDDDRRAVVDMAGDGCVAAVVPNGVDVDRYAVCWGGDREARTIVFPAAFSYRPNREAASELVESVLPELALAHPDCRLLLVGPQPGPALTAAADHRLEVTGPVPDVRPFLARASAMVVPLRSGGGTRLKIIEAFAGGVPVVSTAKGAEGLAVTPGIELLVGETATELAEQVLVMWSDSRLTAAVQDAARQFVVDRHSLPVVAAAVAKTCRALGSTS